ncbi:MAG: single-stranded DNA-binding protein [Oscillospiraceae bacterium]|jgi:single-strand DNA-binding protein|nr:single-stranded DNA-binding protein [Oscillospiraceae bacterium]
MGLNQVTVTGRLGKNVELHHTQSGLAVASFSLAVERDYKSEGEEKRGVDWLDCCAWRATAEFVEKYFSKGDAMTVTGRLQVRPWEDKDGNKRRSTEILVDRVYFGGSKREGERRTDYDDSDAPPYAGASAGAEFVEMEEDDGDLPF